MISSPHSKTTGTAYPGFMLRPSIDRVQCDAAQMALLIDQHREFVALAAGKQMEICMALGDRDGARRAMKEMNVQTAARQAVRSSGCYFDQAGEQDSTALQGSAN